MNTIKTLKKPRTCYKMTHIASCDKKNASTKRTKQVRKTDTMLTNRPTKSKVTRLVFLWTSLAMHICMCTWCCQQQYATMTTEDGKSVESVSIVTTTIENDISQHNIFFSFSLQLETHFQVIQRVEVVCVYFAIDPQLNSKHNWTDRPGIRTGQLNYWQLCTCAHHWSLFVQSVRSTEWSEWVRDKERESERLLNSCRNSVWIWPWI